MGTKAGSGLLSYSIEFRVTRYLIFSVAILGNACFHYSNRAGSTDVISEMNPPKLLLVDSGAANFEGLFARSATYYFYQSNHFNPVWLKNKINNSLADSMIYIIRNARMYGLLPKDYHVDELNSLFREQSKYHVQAYTNRVEILLTDAFFTLTNHITSGRITPDSLTRYETGVLSDSLQIGLLTSVLQRNEISSILHEREPNHFTYHKLQQTLRQLLNQADSSFRQQLLSGYSIDSSEASAKIIALEINMERWRWEQRMKGRYIGVNIPAYSLEVVENDSVVLRSKVIVGTSTNQTPVLDGLIKSFTIYPYWNVTRNIAVKEILPQLKNDSFYLQAHHYEVLSPEGSLMDPASIDWSQYGSDNFPFILRQQQGVHNALGLIKFSFNNPYSVYLHDTNARLMFNRSKRSLSHGCVRVERALEIGRYLLENSDLVTPEDLDQYLEMQKQITIKVDEPIPVHLRYFTCVVQADSIVYLDDIYGKDKLIREKIYSDLLQEGNVSMEESVKVQNKKSL